MPGWARQAIGRGARSLLAAALGLNPTILPGQQLGLPSLPPPPSPTRPAGPGEPPRPVTFTELGLRPISELGINIEPSPGRLPDRVMALPPEGVAPPPGFAFDPRWPVKPYFWEAPATLHKPIYWNEWHLERAAISHRPFVQPVVSAARFYATFPALPVLMVIHPPCECIYTLGYGPAVPELVSHPVPVPIAPGPAPAGAAH